MKKISSTFNLLAINNSSSYNTINGTRGTHVHSTITITIHINRYHRNPRSQYHHNHHSHQPVPEVPTFTGQLLQLAEGSGVGVGPDGGVDEVAVAGHPVQHCLGDGRHRHHHQVRPRLVQTGALAADTTNRVPDSFKP